MELVKQEGLAAHWPRAAVGQDGLQGRELRQVEGEGAPRTAPGDLEGPIVQQLDHVASSVTRFL